MADTVLHLLYRHHALVVLVSQETKIQLKKEVISVLCNKLSLVHVTCQIIHEHVAVTSIGERRVATH